MRTVIFDMDGVLIDSEPVNIAMLQNYGEESGMNLPLALILDHVGAPGHIFWKEVEKHNPNIAWEQAMQGYRTYKSVQKISYREILFPNVTGILEHLKNVGWKLGLATSTYRETTDKILKECGIQRFFSEVVCGDEVEKGKPEPDIFLCTAKKLASAPKECIVIEDSYRGVLAAKRAGMYVIGKSDNRFRQDISAADIIVKSLTEAENVLLSADADDVSGLT